MKDYRQDGTVNWESDWLKILVKTPTSRSTQSRKDVFLLARYKDLLVNFSVQYKHNPL